MESNRRGLVGRPWLISEAMDGEEWDKVKRIKKMVFEYWVNLVDYYSSTLSGETQLISKIKTILGI